MADALTSFLVELATDPRKRSQYASDPAAYLERTGLPLEARQALVDGDRARFDALARVVLGADTCGKPVKMRQPKKRPPRRKPPRKKPPKKRARR